MLPEIIDTTVESLPEFTYPSNTYQIDFENKRITRTVDGIDAIRQAIHKIIQTERYADLIYSWNYGSELEQFVGADFDFIKASAEGAIRAALLMDDRITGVSEFSITQRGIDSCLITFIVETVEGNAHVQEVIQV